MSLDNIQLSPVLVKKLYSHCLYQMEPAKQHFENNPSDTDLSSLGNNEKNILIVVNDKQALHATESDLKLLTDILIACQLTLADVALVNMDKNPAADYSTLNRQFIPRKIFLFGVSPASLGFPLHFPEFQLQAYNGQQYLLSPSLASLNQNRSEKMQLWQLLQKIFKA